jgi:hypothetical protein
MTGSSSIDDIQQLIAGHNAYFGRIIDLFPKDLYRSKDDNQEESIANQKYYKVIDVEYFSY